jgi:hypothetical protein
MEEWSKRLLDHFFARHSPGDSAPVSTLLVTAEEIASVTGDPDAKPDEVKAVFVDTVLAAAGEVTVMEHAFQLPWSPEAPATIPPVMAHLMLACLAASESTEEFADEGSYIRRLEVLARGRFGKLEHMPHHWTPPAAPAGTFNADRIHGEPRVPRPARPTRSFLAAVEAWPRPG